MSSLERDPEIVEDDARDDDDMPRVRITRRMVVTGAVFILVALACLYFVLPKLTGLNQTWHRIEQGDPAWLVVAAVFTVLSFGGYVLLFQKVYVTSNSPIDFKASYEITMASLAATRLFAAGGAGGIALTAWALRRAGMARRHIADSTVVFLVLTYVIYMAMLVLVGLGMGTGLLPGPRPFAMTIVPAIFGGVAIAVFSALALVPIDIERRFRTWAHEHSRPRVARIGTRLATVPATVSVGVRISIRHVREGNLSILGALAYWAFNIAILWAAFRAFGEAPAWPVIVMAYYVGMLGNLLPLPGGVGGVDGGMIGSFAAFGVDFGLATVAVLTYRAFAFWLPTIPGAIAYFQLRRTVRRWRHVPVLH